MGRAKSEPRTLRTKHASTAGLRNKALRARSVEANVSAAVLPPSEEATRRALESLLCPFCARGPFQSVPAHTVRVHGVSSRELHDLAGLPYEASLVSDALRQRRIEIARQVGPPPPGAAVGHPRRNSGANSAALRERVQKISSPEQRAAATAAAHTPDAKARRVATLRAQGENRLGPPEHGTRRMYRGRGCRCDECRAWNTQAHRDYLTSRS